MKIQNKGCILMNFYEQIIFSQVARNVWVCT